MRRCDRGIIFIYVSSLPGRKELRKVDVSYTEKNRDRTVGIDIFSIPNFQVLSLA